MRTGSMIAAALAGSWRSEAPPAGIGPDDLSSICDILLRTGSAGLAYRRIRGTPLEESPSGILLKQAYRMILLQEAMHEREVLQAFALFRAAGVEPLLGKGWAIARRYPERGLRPFGDLDIYTRMEEHPLAVAALEGFDARGFDIDLQAGCRDLSRDREVEQLFIRSELVPLKDDRIRILGPEDHLRLLCLHMMGHGVWRPLWLCDIALILESPTATFDWSYLLSGHRRRTEATLCAIGLAAAILDAVLPEPVAGCPGKLPRWLVPAVLRQWSAGEHYMESNLRAHLTRPRELLHAARLRWPNAVQATVALGAPFDNLPRWPLQAADSVRRAALFLRKMV